ncbi:glycosyltransferase family 2 protein [Thiomonas sp.]
MPQDAIPRPFQTAVLMSTWNGKPWIDQQLQSLLDQSWPHFRIRIRDDGSTDGTQEILERWHRLSPERLTWYQGGSRLGPAGSFSELASQCTADYVLFCDQDDVWHPDKVGISQAEMARLERRMGRNTPLLIHTDLTVCDEQLAVLDPSFWRHQALNPAKNQLNRLLLQNVVTGCTAMANRALLQAAGPVPPDAIMHDWWLALVASAFGHIQPIRMATVQYRQHGRNVCGAPRKALSWAYIRDKLRQPRGGRDGYQAALRPYFRQAEAFARRFDGTRPGYRLTASQRKMLQALVTLPRESFLARRYRIFRYGFWKQEWFRNLGWLARA